MSASAKHLASAKNQAQAGNKLFRADQEEEEAEAGEVAEEGALAGHSREDREDLAAGAQIAATTLRSASMPAISSTTGMPTSQAAC